MIITKIVIENFKIFKHQEFEFGNNRLILLTGANGFGKTTLIDAIEWCLTGEISRLKTCYGERNSSQSEKERAENKKGIIKNHVSKKDDLVKVELTLIIDKEEIHVYREQIEDSLYISTELKYYANATDLIKERIKQFAANNRFYNYHVCDMNKSYNFMNLDRKEIKKQFDEFIKPHINADNLSQKLNEYQIIIDEKINILENSKTSFEKLKTEENELETLKTNAKVLDYPQVKLYEDENLIIENEAIEKIREQLTRIKECGYQAVDTKIDNILEYYEALEKIKRVDKLIDIVSEKEGEIYTSIKNSYYNIETLNVISKSIIEVSDERKKTENAKKLTDLDISTKPYIYSEIINDINFQTNVITEFEAKLYIIQGVVREKEKGNEIITALSNMVISREGVIKYKNEGYTKCPLCGSDEKFNKIFELSELAVEAEVYLVKSQSDLVDMKKTEKDINDSINIYVEQLKQYIIKYLDAKLLVYETQKKNFIDNYEKTKDFFTELESVFIPVNDETIENIKKYRVELSRILLNEEIIDSDLEKVKNILIVLEYGFDKEIGLLELLKKLKIDMKHFSKETTNVFEFAFDDYNQKLLFINNILNNSIINEKVLLIKKYKEDNEIISNNIKKLGTYKFKAKKRHDEIERKKTDIEKYELEAVGPYLYKIFVKVIKHTRVTNFSFKRDSSKAGGGATFSDQHGNNIMNTFSQGQFGIFMLAYFFANMFKRKDETEFRTYFVDDITSCMDDMNMLSFIDIIKYQLYQSESVINQLFFSTCDGDLEKLIINKMKSFDVDFINFKFNSYARGIIGDKSNQIVPFG